MKSYSKNEVHEILSNKELFERVFPNLSEREKIGFLKKIGKFESDFTSYK